MNRIVILISLVFLSISPLAASQDDDIAEGGRLYDKWWEEYDLKPPRNTHPAYPASGKKKGATTWRCKECHGWDYRGKDGAYRKGSHFTGITGIQSYTGKPADEILPILKNKTHRFDDVMYDRALKLISLFISKGMVDSTPYINEQGEVKGTASVGRPVFRKICMDCHGRDGQEINFKNKKSPEYVGTVANKNPWETLHKIRNGHPGAYVMGDPMPHMRGELSLQEQLDLLKYLQTLPR